MKLTRVIWLLAAFFGLSGPVLVFLTQLNSDRVAAPVALGFSIWMISPYAHLALAARDSRSPVVTKGALVLTIVVGVLGALAYADLRFHLFSRPDPQDGIALLFLPLVQHIGVVTVLGLLVTISDIAERRKKSREP